MLVRVTVETGAVIDRLAKDAKNGNTQAARELREWLSKVEAETDTSVSALDRATRQRMKARLLAEMAEAPMPTAPSAEAPMPTAPSTAPSAEAPMPTAPSTAPSAEAPMPTAPSTAPSAKGDAQSALPRSPNGPDQPAAHGAMGQWGDGAEPHGEAHPADAGTPVDADA